MLEASESVRLALIQEHDVLDLDILKKKKKTRSKSIIQLHGPLTACKGSINVMLYFAWNVSLWVKSLLWIPGRRFFPAEHFIVPAVC